MGKHSGQKNADVQIMYFMVNFKSATAVCLTAREKYVVDELESKGWVKISILFWLIYFYCTYWHTLSVRAI